MAATGSFVMSRLVLKSITWPRQRFCSLADQPPVVVPVDLYSTTGRKNSTTAAITSTFASNCETLWTSTAPNAAANASAMYCPELNRFQFFGNPGSDQPFRVCPRPGTKGPP